jgi:hypothetical protein
MTNITKSGDPIGTKINIYGVFTEATILKKEILKSVRFCKSYRRRKKISQTVLRKSTFSYVLRIVQPEYYHFVHDFTSISLGNMQLYFI